jgi:hypothetical protein
MAIPGKNSAIQDNDLARPMEYKTETPRLFSGVFVWDQWLLLGTADDFAVFHDEVYFAQRLHVLERVTGHGDDVGK